MVTYRFQMGFCHRSHICLYPTGCANDFFLLSDTKFFRFGGEGEGVLALFELVNELELGLERLRVRFRFLGLLLRLRFLIAVVLRS